VATRLAATEGVIPCDATNLPPPWGGGGFEGASASEKTGAGSLASPSPCPLPLGSGGEGAGFSTSSRRFLALFAALALAGCGSSGPKKSQPKEAPKEPAKSIASGPITLTQKDAKGNAAWEVKGDASQIVYADGKAEGQLANVSGTVEGDKCAFTAKLAKANQKSEELELTGSVVVTSKEGNVLKANKVTWMKGQGLIRATGDVTFVSPSYTSGPFPALVASSDLKRIGTPDSFPSTIEKKSAP